ncbi:MAG TPA: hypothetical protein DEP42_04540 [Ruminococcaceae bacterium]|nr:hypothetical protein [Oscillospiraceae bacterium]
MPNPAAGIIAFFIFIYWPPNLIIFDYSTPDGRCVVFSCYLGEIIRQISPYFTCILRFLVKKSSEFWKPKAHQNSILGLNKKRTKSAARPKPDDAF